MSSSKLPSQASKAAFRRSVTSCGGSSMAKSPRYAWWTTAHGSCGVQLAPSRAVSFSARTGRVDIYACPSAIALLFRVSRTYRYPSPGDSVDIQAANKATRAL